MYSEYLYDRPPDLGYNPFGYYEDGRLPEYDQEEQNLEVKALIDALSESEKARPEEPPRKGDWVETFSGKAFWPLDPREEEVDLIDIAHSLSMKTRFNGMCIKHYSVAEHAVRCAVYALATTHDRNFALALLHHDSSEAYLPDVPRPLKPYLTNFKEIEDGISEVVFKKFGVKRLSKDQQKRLKEIDTILLATEARDLMQPGVLERWNLPAKPLQETIKPWPRKKAKDLFGCWHNVLSTTENDALPNICLTLLQAHDVFPNYS